MITYMFTGPEAIKLIDFIDYPIFSSHPPPCPPTSKNSNNTLQPGLMSKGTLSSFHIVLGNLIILTCRYTPSQADVHVFKLVGAAPDASKLPHIARWFTHIKSYEAEHGSLPGSSTAGKSFTSAAAPPAPAEDEDEVDLFGSDDEEDAEAERIKAERVAAYNAKKANKPKAVAKVECKSSSSTPLC